MEQSSGHTHTTTNKQRYSLYPPCCLTCHDKKWLEAWRELFYVTPEEGSTQTLKYHLLSESHNFLGRNKTSKTLHTSCLINWLFFCVEMMLSIASKLDDYFLVSYRNSDIISEVRAGICNFLEMSYILFINPAILARAGMDPTKVAMATAASTAIATLMCGIFANLPFGLAPGLGMSAYVTYGLAHSGYSWETALTMCFISGVITCVLSMLRLSELVMKLIPACIKVGSVVGMGLMLSFVGFTSIGLPFGDAHRSDGTLSAAVLLDEAPRTLITSGLAFAGMVLITLFSYHQIRGGRLLGTVLVSVVFWWFHDSWPTAIFGNPLSLTPTSSSFPLDFASLDWMCIPPIISLVFVSVFDLTGVMYGLARLAVLVPDDTPVDGRWWTFFSASTGSMVAAVLGSGPVVILVESAAGIKDGGRTGLSAVVTGLLFALCIFAAPLLGSIPFVASSPMLVLIGAMMMGEVRNIDWDDMNQAVSAFLTIMIMPYSYSIADALIGGLLVYLVLWVFARNHWGGNGGDDYDELAEDSSREEEYYGVDPGSPLLNRGGSLSSSSGAERIAGVDQPSAWHPFKSVANLVEEDPRAVLSSLSQQQQQGGYGRKTGAYGATSINNNYQAAGAPSYSNNTRGANP